MQLPSPNTELRDSSGFSQNPAVSFRATRAGTYYVAIFAPDWNLPGEQGQVGQGPRAALRAAHAVQPDAAALAQIARELGSRGCPAQHSSPAVPASSAAA